MSDSTLNNIDAAIAYLESPAYLRQVAAAQGEDPSSLLAGTAWWQQSDPVPLSEPEPERTSPVQWDRVTDRCLCGGCNSRRLQDMVRPRVLTPVRLHIRRDPPEAYADALSELRPFTTMTNNLRGVVSPERPLGDTTPVSANDPAPCGKLQSKSLSAAALWRADQRAIDYVVYSYDTPIAWHVAGDRWSEWVYPKIDYTATTRQHQAKIKEALRSPILFRTAEDGRSHSVRYIE